MPQQCRTLLVSTRLFPHSPSSSRLVYLRSTGRLLRSSAYIHPRRSASTARGKSRKSVTVLSDDGRISWTDLSAREKLARTTQQTFNLGLVLLGAAMTGGIVWLLWTNVAAPSSKTALFNRSVSELRASAQVRELLGPGKQIRAFGQGQRWNRWSRNATIPATFETDARGVEHARLSFNVEGPHGKGTVSVHMSRADKSKEFEFRRLAVDVQGHATVFVYNDEKAKDPGKGVRFLGFDWTRK